MPFQPREMCSIAQPTDFVPADAKMQK